MQNSELAKNAIHDFVHFFTCLNLQYIWEKIKDHNFTRIWIKFHFDIVYFVFFFFELYDLKCITEEEYLKKESTKTCFFVHTVFAFKKINQCRNFDGACIANLVRFCGITKIFSHIISSVFSETSLKITIKLWRLK